MQTTLLSGFRHDWLVMGSNGSVGRELTEALLQSNLIDKQQPLDTWTHPREEYPDIGMQLLRCRSSSQPLRLLFCGGRGGFSLPQTSANQQHQAFSAFCNKICRFDHLEKLILVSSLGAVCSQLNSPYSQLSYANEQSLLNSFGDRSLILRLPSVYGYNELSCRYHGLIGVILQNLRLRRPTSIYARMETRRNYLSIRRLARVLTRDRSGGIYLEKSGCFNIQSSLSLTIFDVCASFCRAFSRRPVLRLVDHSLVDSENHYPSRLNGAKLIINDSVCEWLRCQRMVSAR